MFIAEAGCGDGILPPQNRALRSAAARSRGGEAMLPQLSRDSVAASCRNHGKCVFVGAPSGEISADSAQRVAGGRRHIELEAAARAITPMLRDDIPLERLWVRRMNRDRTAIETLACGSLDAERTFSLDRTPCAKAALACNSLAGAVVAWLSNGPIIRRRRLS